MYRDIAMNAWEGRGSAEGTGGGGGAEVCRAR